MPGHRLAGASPLSSLMRFRGCGGLSLGLLRAGWHGLFVLEKDGFAFDSYRSNLLDGRFKKVFQWPVWLPQATMCVEAVIDEHREHLTGLRGKVALLAGGPPCQGFSSAGRRDAADPRNRLMRAYLELVDLVQPAMVLLENVRGITLDFNRPADGEGPVNYPDFVRKALHADYSVYWSMENASDYGVPQARNRFILVALHKTLGVQAEVVRKQIDAARRRFLRRHRLVPRPLRSRRSQTLNLKEMVQAPAPRAAASRPYGTLGHAHIISG